jgi:uncharacterized protein
MNRRRFIKSTALAAAGTWVSLARGSQAGMSKKTPSLIVDAHTHLGVVPSHRRGLEDKIRTKEDLIAFRTRYPELFARRLQEKLEDNSDDLIAAMDQHGIDKAMTQLTAGDVSNDMVAAAVKKYPDRLYGQLRVGQNQVNTNYAEDPAAVRARAAEEVKRGVEELGLIAVGTIAARGFTREIHPEKIADDLTPIMDAVNHYKIPIEFPTAWTQFGGGLPYGNPEWVDEVANRYPQVPIILSKMGRSVTFYFEMCMMVAMRNENVHFDIVGTSSDHLRQAVETIGANRIMFGTDWSGSWRWVVDPEDVHTRHKRIVEEAGLSDKQKEWIYWRTANKVFNLKLA